MPALSGCCKLRCGYYAINIPNHIGFSMHPTPPHHLTPHHPTPPPPHPHTHNGHHHSEGGGPPIVPGLHPQDDGRGHGLGQLVCPHGVPLQGQVGEDHEAAEGRAQGEEVGQRDPLWGQHVEPGADPHPQARDGKVEQGEGHAGKPVVHIDELIDKDDGDGRDKVEQDVQDNHSAWLGHRALCRDVHLHYLHGGCVCVGG